MSSEKAFWINVRPKLVDAARGGRWDRVENGVSAGMPDVNFCVEGCEGWIELKWARKLPGKRSSKGVFEYTGNHGLTREQENWAIAQKQSGGHVVIIAGSKGHLWIIPGLFNFSLFNSLPVSGLDPFDFGARPDWKKVVQQLFY